MRIGIIGAGQIGATLVRQYTKAGHQVKVANASGLEKLVPLEKETGARAVLLHDVAEEADILVVSIPFFEIPNLAKTIGKKITASTIIIDTTNYYPIRDGRIEAIEEGMAESVWVSNHLGHPVIKAYNSIFSGSLAQSGLPNGTAGRIALPISGDNEHAKKLVSTLVNDSGFDAVDIGNLNDSWKQQPGSPVYCTDLTLSQVKRNLTNIRKERLPERREITLQFILRQNPADWLAWWKECVPHNRIVYETDLID